jgi:hypothetical protein
MKTELKPQQKGVLVAALVTVLLWIIPGGHYLTLPIQFLDTHLHEMSHALAAIGTGGSVDSIRVLSNGSGVTWSYTSHPVIVGNAGYMGASLIGALMVACSRTVKASRYAFLVIAGLLLVEDLLWLRGDVVGEVTGFAYLLLFVALGFGLNGWAAIVVAQFFGLQQCLTSIQSVLILVNPSLLAVSHNDATNMYNATGVPAIIWACSWVLFSGVVMVVGLLNAWKPPRDRPSSPAPAN